MWWPASLPHVTHPTALAKIIQRPKNTSVPQTINDLDWATWHNLIGLEKMKYSRNIPVDYTCMLTGHLVTKILLFGKTNEMWYLPHTTLVFQTICGIRMEMRRVFQSLKFGIVLSTLNFEHNTWSPYQTSPLGIFWTPKDFNYMFRRWGYNSLTFPTSIHPALLSLLPLSPNRR